MKLKARVKMSTVQLDLMCCKVNLFIGLAAGKTKNVLTENDHFEFTDIRQQKQFPSVKALIKFNASLNNISAFPFLVYVLVIYIQFTPSVILSLKKADVSAEIF